MSKSSSASSPMDCIENAATALADATNTMNANIEREADALAKATERMKLKASELEAKEAHWLELERRVQANLADAPKMVTLNVGGSLFTTSKETLLRVEGSYFHAMLGSGHWKPDYGNAYFLDLHDPMFDRVLTFLCTNKLWLDGLTKFEETELRTSMKYLQLACPFALSWNISACSHRTDLSNGMQTATRTKLNRSYIGSVSGTEPVTSFDVCLDEIGLNHYVVLSARSSYPPVGNGCNHGFFVRVYDGYKSSHVISDDQPCFDFVFAHGDIVTVRVANGNEVHFDKNGEDLGIAFKVADPTVVPLNPVVIMYNPGSVTLIP
ncbi:Aste57867_4958 [Aphanomyces stellatus]|uniref:Aste57867_4958 protein n=1 Tax=Aphanomyces stellatus TaxID=120398 RepID=A0A485KGJ2_9STRA|nr:hypothetical protein As57867_004945 [Aphanomyces stellatus]VFT82046.1 Aste57867_4958 [Aphanomyces stellatus]